MDDIVIMATIDYQDGNQLMAEFHSWQELAQFNDRHNADIVSITARQAQREADQ